MADEASSSQQQEQQQQQQPGDWDWRQQGEYYAESSFGGVQATSRVYTGPFLGISLAAIFGSLIMSQVVRKSPNLSFVWLQRRVGAQAMAFAYFFSTNLLYYYDGRRWRTRDLDKLYHRAFGPLLMKLERRRLAKEATQKVTGGVHPTS